MNYLILQANINDAQDILALQKLAYQSEAKLYNNYNIFPLTQTLDQIKEQFKNYIFLKALENNKLIGSVRAYQKDDICYIGRLAVDLRYQNLGIGSSLMKGIEKYFNPKRFELFVGAKSEKNIYLYKKLGYTVFRKAKYGCGEDIEILYMEKTI